MRKSIGSCLLKSLKVGANDPARVIFSLKERNSPPVSIQIRSAKIIAS